MHDPETPTRTTRATTGRAMPIATPAAKVVAPAPLVVNRAGTDALRVLFVGDSITGGFFASTEAAGFKQVMIAGMGKVEQTTAARARQTLSTVSGITDVPSNVDLAVVELGTNDVGIPTPLDAFREQYTGLLTKITTASPKAAILCAGTWTDNGSRYDRVIESACVKAGGRFVPLAALFDTSDFHGPANVATRNGESDVFHPNDSGHQAIARDLLAAIHVK
jgi:lysophospholipase L1-like esterase